jgi:hypothetical protein
MPERDPAGAAVLERRYRRLLRSYPPAHREFHREEMLGVLLAAARPGQRAPGLRQAVNLAACGLVIRVRRIPGWLAADAGQDALAVVSLITPAVMVIRIALELGATYATWTEGLPFLPSLGQWIVLIIAWLAVVLLGLAGRRGAAAAVASLSLTIAWLALLTAGVQQSNFLSAGLAEFLGWGNIPVILASLAACSLALSPGPRRGLAIVGWRRACLMIAGLSAGFGFPSIVQLARLAAPLGDFRLLGVLAIVLAVAVTRVRGPVGRRVTGLIGTGLLPSLALTIPVLYRGLAGVLVILAVAALLWPVAIVSWLGRARRAGWGPRGMLRGLVLHLRGNGGGTVAGPARLVELARTRSSRARWPRQL